MEKDNGLKQATKELIEQAIHQEFVSVLRYIKDCEDLDKLRTIHRMSDNKISFETAYIEFMEDKEY